MFDSEDINEIEKRIKLYSTHKLKSQEYFDLFGQAYIKRFNHKHDIKDVDEALKCFDEALKLKESIDIYYRRAKALIIKNEKEKAKEDYLNAKSLNSKLVKSKMDEFYYKNLLEELEEIFTEKNENYIVYCDQKFEKIKEVPSELYPLIIENNYLFLSTSRSNNPDTHMMMFAYCDDEKVFILSSKKDKKIEDISLNPNVSALLYSKDQTSAITLYSKAILPNDSKKYKQILTNKYQENKSVFFKEDSLIILIPIDKLLICTLEGKSSRVVLS